MVIFNSYVKLPEGIMFPLSELAENSSPILRQTRRQPKLETAGYPLWNGTFVTIFHDGHPSAFQNGITIGFFSFPFWKWPDWFIDDRDEENLLFLWTIHQSELIMALDSVLDDPVLDEQKSW